MSKLTQKSKYTIPPLLLALIFIQCVFSLYVIISQQTKIEHQAVLEKIYNLKEKELKYCNSKIQK